MKKLFLAGLMACIMAVGAFAVYADSADTNRFSYKRGSNHMMEVSSEGDREIEFNVPETEAKAQAWQTHVDEMDKYHKENGFEGGHCHDGRSSGRHGRGMMGRNRY